MIGQNLEVSHLRKHECMKKYDFKLQHKHEAERMRNRFMYVSEG